MPQMYGQQKDVWQGMNAQKQKAGKAVQKQKGLAKKWMRHVQEWGTDETYNYELSIGANLHTNGFGGHLRYVNNSQNTTKTVWLLNVNTIKHEKEIKQQRQGEQFRDLGTFRPYYLGKVNSVLNIQAGYGKEQLLLPSLVDDNISVYGSFVLGAALIVQKPVYLSLIYTDPSGHFIQSEKYNSINKDQFLSSSRILGGDKWSKGLGDAKLIPGIFVEPAFVFVPSKNKTFIQRIYIGANLSYYINGVEIMALHKARPFHASFYVGLGLGKRG